MSAPTSVRTIHTLLILIALAHSAIPFVMNARRAELSAEIATKNPTFDINTVNESVAIAVRSASVFHTVAVVVCLVGMWSLRSRRRWAGRFLLVSQAMSIAFSVISWSSSAMFHALIPVLDLAALAVVVLAWSTSARHFYRNGRE
ncbi:hypothetical protein O4220_01530 [Rhodococcus ruber]|uniref:Uncharacterized protein n=1 Tax=Rhodococcus ruber TaxID=1830 RepID=A0ABT4M8B8_9NOCA|nr:hypothetical protein [Rhodococcus ruber]MCZ4517179.1 hypothetical protein [Rhodococcus ruber]